jgi:hypothetical protein
MKFPLMWRSTHEDILLEHIITIAHLRKKNGELTRALGKCEKDLAKSQRNDSPQGPKGRFVKKKK